MKVIIFYFMASKCIYHGSVWVIPKKDHTQFLHKSGSVKIIDSDYELPLFTCAYTQLFKMFYNVHAKSMRTKQFC